MNAIRVDFEHTPTAMAQVVDVSVKLRETIGYDALDDDAWLAVSSALVDAMAIGVRAGVAELAAIVRENGVTLDIQMLPSPE